MVESPTRGIKVGVDFDGVARHLDSRRFHQATKLGLTMVDEAPEGIKLLRGHSNIDLLGFYTTRMRIFRGLQTRLDAKRTFGVNEVVYANNSSITKLDKLFRDATAIVQPDGTRTWNRDKDEWIVPDPQLKQIVLIDDSAKKILAAAESLKFTHPEFTHIFKIFTYIAFNPKDREELNKEEYPGIKNFVIANNWNDVKQIFNRMNEANNPQPIAA